MARESVKILQGKLDVESLIAQLNAALAEEWLAYYQYWVGALVVEGAMRADVQGEFEEHAEEERRHAQLLADRIIELEGVPVLDPKQWFELARCKYDAPQGFDSVSLLKDNVASERCAILRYQENGIADLLTSDWYGIMLLSPGGRVYLDNYNDIHGIGNDVPLEFVRNCVEWDSLIHNKSMTYTYKEWNFLIYSIRQTDKGNCVFFLHCRKDKPFDARDVKWYELYSAVGQQRVLLENELIQEKNYLNSILESSEGCIAVVDEDNNIVSANDEAKALFGNNLSQTPSGEMLSLIKAVKQVLSQKEKIVLPRMIVNGTENEFGFSIYKFILTPLRSSKGRVGCVVVVATDITHDFINKRRATQRQNFRMAGNINFETAKEMRTPLMNIEGCASLLTDAVGDNKDSKELLTYIKEEVNHILQINNRMLSFSNLTQENTYGQIDVNEVLKNCVSALYTQRTKKKLSIETKMDADLPLVRAENADIQQIFFNLLFSAFDNAKEKGKIQVDSHYDDQAGEIVVDFEHEGSGNVLDDRQLCLQINGREKGQIDIPFLMAKKMVLDCGGQLFTQEREDGGSVRTVKFPCS